ncbi:MAG: hypothetical protein HRU19_26145 [Pseudobacteriovorax sp.]|nr:hypothetical protein [Pseudobacteriovorax sp.]
MKEILKKISNEQHELRILRSDGLGWKVPDWLDEALLQKTPKKFHSLHGHWKATPFGSTMEMEWIE